MLQSATVKRLLPDSKAEIAVIRESACSHDCASCGGGCATMYPQSEVVVTAENGIHAQEGARVLVEASTKHILGAAAIVYLIPFLLFFAGYVWADSWKSGEAAAIASGFGGFMIGMIFAFLLNRSWKKKQPNYRIVEILSD